MEKTKRKRKKKTKDYVGRVAVLPMDDMLIEVAIIGQSWAFGFDLVDVKPVRGDGQKRVRVESLQFA